MKASYIIKKFFLKGYRIRRYMGVYLFTAPDGSVSEFNSLNEAYFNILR